MPNAAAERRKTKRQLLDENGALRLRVAELEAALAHREPQAEQAPLRLPANRRSRLRRPLDPNEQLAQEREHAYAHLRRQADFNRAITEHLGEGVYALDHEGRLTFMNPAAQRLLGWRSAELIGKDMHARVHARGPEGQCPYGAACPMLRILREGQTVRVEDDAFTRRDGTPLPVAYVGTPLITDERVVGAVLAFRDTADQREREARASQLEATFEAIADAVFVYDAQGTLLRLNDAARELLALPAQPDYVRAPLADRLPQIALRDAQGELLPQERWPQTRLLRGESFGGSHAVDYRMRDLAGHERHINTSGAPVRSPTGEIIGAVLICRDVTERRRVEREISATAGALVHLAAALEGQPPPA